MSKHPFARVLIYSHRWLGIVLGLLFVIWFASGIVMMYARMPELDPAERLARLHAINPASIRADPPLSSDLSRLSIGTIEGRPVFRITAGARSRVVFADTGDDVPPVDADQAVRIARAFTGQPLRPSGVAADRDHVRYHSKLIDADQWSFGVRGLMPLHRIDVDDEAGTRLYVTERDGQVVLKTTASGRWWGWTGAVLHWLYFTPLRRNAALWNEVVVWSSIAGTVMCIAGLLWGLWRLAPWRGYRLRRERHWSPYAGWMRWHHYLGLIFGALTMTWIFSGLLSMDPWDWHPGTAPTRDQRQLVAGGAMLASELSAVRLQAAVKAFLPRMVKEVEIVKFRGRCYASAGDGIVSLDEPHLGAADQLPADLIVGAASVAMPGVPIEGMQWMDEYDAYYYDRDHGRTLPVLRVRYGDAQRTWLYFDPRHGTIARKEERLTRVNRWLYHGFHSFDFPFLYYRRPLWDGVVMALSLGGLALSVTTLTASWRRLRRHARRITSRRAAS